VFALREIDVCISKQAEKLGLALGLVREIFLVCFFLFTNRVWYCESLLSVPLLPWQCDAVSSMCSQ